MLWVDKEAEAEQIQVDSSDITAAIIRLPDKMVLVISAYVQCVDTTALKDACENIRKTVAKARQKIGLPVEVVVVGDFNRHDPLWGGDDVRLERQGEADLIIDAMNKQGLCSLLRRGTKTWSDGTYDTTIDLVLASGEFREHIARAASKGLEAVLELRRLKGLSPPTARQLFTSTVAPVIDYTPNVWMHVCQYRTASPVQRVQRIGAQAVVGTFMSVATCVAEAEAHIASAQERFWKRAIKMWTDMHTLP